MVDRPPSAILKPIVIAVVGLCGTGKSEVVRIFEEMAPFRTIYFGGVVIDEIRNRGLPVTEETESMVRTELRAKLGMAAMAVMRLEQIQETIADKANVMIDGLYSYSEYRLLLASMAASPVLVAVHSRKDLRVSRLASRPYRPLTALEMDARDRREIEQMEKGGPIALADYHIINDASIVELTAQVRKCADRIGIPGKLQS